jgi:CDP-diacylglycerol--glycerol-3-phosphate 3-phosphatidyltransferase
MQLQRRITVNIPNQITISRVLLIPVFMIFLLAPMRFGEVTIFAETIPITHLVAAILFIIASCTDWVDGYYARKYNLVTNLGKFLDPLADKLLVTAAFISLVELGLAPAWMVIVILAREFAVTGLRLVAVGEGDVIAASKLGKWKTIAQLVAVAALLLHNIPFSVIGFPFADICLWLAVILTIISGWDYFSKNKSVFLTSK